MEDPAGGVAQNARTVLDAQTWKPGVAGIAEIQRRLEERLAAINDGKDERIEAPGRLLFWINGAPYSAALSSLREALPALPAVTPLPFSPDWLIGLFPLRTDLVTLIDVGLALQDDTRSASAADDWTERNIHHALLIGETGRLLAFVVDRIGEIYQDQAPSVSASAPTDVARGIPLRFIETTPRDKADDSGIEVAGLDLARIYGDVIAKLESWARDA